MADDPKRLDPHRLRPFEALRLLNSTGDGEPIRLRAITDALDQGGTRVCARGDLSRVDIVKLCAWLATQRHRRLDEARVRAAAAGGSPGLSGYDAHKDQAARRQRELSKTVRDIGPIPGVADPARKQRCRLSFRSFCETYLPAKFYLEWSDDHLLVIGRIEKAVLHGGLFAIAMPRGSGKSALCEAACLWATLFGHHNFVVLIGEGQKAAIDCLDSVKAEITNNELLAADFPEVCFPVRALEGINQRANGQTCQGVRTQIVWNDDQIVLPTIEGAASSGAVMNIAGMEGRIRGMKYTRPDGRTVRPSLVFVDDPQNDESAHSVTQCAAREAIVQGAILGLAGPDSKLSGLAAVTVIRRDDLAERLLNPELHPQWQGARCKLINAFPSNEEAWETYRKIRREAQEAGDDYVAISNEHYVANRAALDAGAVVAWPARKKADEISAVQHAMNLRIDRGEHIFFAEYQNDPGAAADAEAETLRAPDLLRRLNAVPKGMVPRGAQYLTAFIDVQDKCLWWMVVAWSEDMTGAVVDYGTDPDQASAYFTLREVRRTLEKASPGSGLQGAMRAGLERLLHRLCSQPWQIEGGGTMAIGRAMIDANYAASTEVVYQVCRMSPYAGILIPSHGKGVTAAERPMSQWHRKPGDRTGLNWRVPASVGNREVRHCIYDTNWWKSCVYARLRTPLGDRGAMYLNGKHQERHRMLADHLTSEIPTITAGRGRTVAQWQIRSAGIDNHWWDCMVGCAVAANMLGVTPPGIEYVRRARVSFADLSSRARRG